MTTALNGLHIRGRARQFDPNDYPELVQKANEALEPPMPSYQVFAFEPEAHYLPVIEDGVNTRVEIELD